MKHRHVGILMGGRSAERDISLKTGAAVLDALAERGHRVSQLLVDDRLDQQLRDSDIDVAFVALHGTHGEDGCVQGLLELLGIPYTGSDVLASALAMDKRKAKELFRLYNVPTPPHYAVSAEQLESLEEEHASFGFPVFVKPRRQGSSVGAGRATTLAELHERCRQALRFDDEALVERFVAGREVAVGLLNGRALGAIEIEPRGDFYDYSSKYTRGGSEYHFPARLSPTRYKGVLNIAERAAQSLGVRGASRVDMLVTEGQNEYVLEVNALPGLTPTSLLPKIAAGSGYSFADLCEAILEQANQPRLGARAASDTEGRPAVSSADAAGF